MFDKIVHFIRELYKTDGPIYLLEPAFLGDERKYLADCIDTGFVSTAGPYVEKFENAIAKYTGAKFAVSIVTRFGEFVGDDAPWFIHIALRAQRATMRTRFECGHPLSFQVNRKPVIDPPFADLLPKRSGKL